MAGWCKACVWCNHTWLDGGTQGVWCNHNTWLAGEWRNGGWELGKDGKMDVERMKGCARNGRRDVKR